MTRIKKYLGLLGAISLFAACSGDEQAPGTATPTFDSSFFYNVINERAIEIADGVDARVDGDTIYFGFPSSSDPRSVISPVLDEPDDDPSDDGGILICGCRSELVTACKTYAADACKITSGKFFALCSGSCIATGYGPCYGCGFTVIDDKRR